MTITVRLSNNERRELLKLSQQLELVLSTEQRELLAPELASLTKFIDTARLRTRLNNPLLEEFELFCFTDTTFTRSHCVGYAEVISRLAVPESSLRVRLAEGRGCHVVKRPTESFVVFRLRQRQPPSVLPDDCFQFRNHFASASALAQSAS